MKIKVYLLKSFGVNKDGGNPAGVVLDADYLSDEQKKSIARKIGFSETAFVEKSAKADFKVRFFTPSKEVNICGHATVAVYSLLFQKSILKPGKYTQELKAGVLEVEIRENGSIMMEQPLPKFFEQVDNKDMDGIFNQTILFNDLKPQLISTGDRDIILPITTRDSLFSLKPNFKKIIGLNKKTNSIGIHAFTLETIVPDAVAHSRNFSPLYEINEESATGSSTGSLACYLYHFGKLSDKDIKNLKFEQGYSMKKPCEIFVSLKINKEKIIKVYIGGKAIIFGEKQIEI